MKKIEFGFNDDDRLNGQWSGIEFYNGEFLDLLNYEGMDFLITKIVDSPRGLNGNIDVREIAQDYYADGSYITYGNKMKNTACQRLEELLNKGKIKQRVLSGISPVMVLNSEGLPVRTSYLLDVTSKLDNTSAVLTSVKREVFDKLKASKKYFRGKSMYDMAIERQQMLLELENLRKEVAKYQKVESKGVSR